MIINFDSEKKFKNEIAHNFAEQKEKKFSWDDPESVEKLKNIWNAELGSASCKQEQGQEQDFFPLAPNSYRNTGQEKIFP